MQSKSTHTDQSNDSPESPDTRTTNQLGGTPATLETVSRRVHSLLTGILGHQSAARTDGGRVDSNGETADASSRGSRERSETERTPTQASDSSREYNPYAPICEYCGLPIDHDKQRCPALEQGRCRP